MSRPFSYNDENFTVIGNILFVHFNDTHKRKAKEPVIEVPPEIFNRLYGYTNLAITSYSAEYASSSSFPIIIIQKNGRHYIAFVNDRQSVNFSYRYYYCFYFLKDI